MAPRMMVELDRVTVVFGREPARALPLLDAGRSRAELQAATGLVLGVHDCSLAIREGEISVLMGLSGSGKSTLLRAINGLNPVVRGAVRVRSGEGGMVDVGACPPAQLRALRRGAVSMVFQQFALLPWRSVIENVALGLELARVPRAARLDRARAVLATVGLDGWADKRVSELSGGMQQRVGLARAFATEADLLLMDEPFSALDPLIRARLQDELLALQARMGVTIVFVSHDLEEAVKLGDTITILEGGRIVQSGAPQDIVLRPGNDYVADFVARLNPLSVLRVEDVMAPAGPEPAPGRVVAPGTALRDTLPLFAAADAPVWVADASGMRGMIPPAAVFALLSPRADEAPLRQSIAS